MLDGHRSVEHLDFLAGPFTVLFGKNNAGKTNILEAVAGLLDPSGDWDSRRTHTDRGSRVWGGAVTQLEPGQPFDDAVLALLAETYGEPWGQPVTFTNHGVVRGDLSTFEDPEVGVPDPQAIEAVAVDDAPRVHPLVLDWRFEGLHERVETAISDLSLTKSHRMRGDWPWLCQRFAGSDPLSARWN